MLRQFYLLRGTPARIVPYFLWSVLDIILWGFITRFLAGLTGDGASIAIAFLGAVILLDFFTRVMQGITTTFFEDVWTQNFLNLFGSPIKLAEYITGLSITSIITTFMTMVVVIVIAIMVFGFSIFSYGIALVPFALVLFLTGIALGIFAVSVVLRLGPSAEWFIWPIPAVLTPFVGVFYPIATLPTWMQWIAHALPPSYVFEGMRAVLTTGTYALSPLLVAGALALIYIVLAYAFLTKIYRGALTSGLIARYSAESPS